MRQPAILALASTMLAADPAMAALQLSQDGLTVYDTAGNVTWLADFNLAASNRFGLPLCNGSGSRTQICVNATGSMTYQAAAAWVAAMNAANYLGHRDWQLPTTPLLDKNCGRTGPTGNSFGFGCTAGAYAAVYNSLGFLSPNTAVPIPANTAGPFNNFQPYLYWSASDGSSPTVGHATFSFATGWQGANTQPNFLYLLPMVRGKLPGTPPANGTALQVNPGGQTVYDPMTDITWLANANLAATNTFGLPRCIDPLTPALCVAQDGSMTWFSAAQFLANMNSAAYLGQTRWEAPTIDNSCPGFNCGGAQNPMGNLFYAQFGLSEGMSVVSAPDVATGPFRRIQPYLYWSCVASRIASPCEATLPADGFEESYSFGAGFQGTDVLGNNLYVTAYFPGSRTGSSGPVIAYVANAESEDPAIASNTWVEIKGVNLAPAGDSRIWQSSDFVGNQMPIQLDRVSVTVNGKSAFVYYISPGQINILTPPYAMSGPVQVVVTHNGTVSSAFTAQARSTSPAFFVFNGGAYVAAIRTDGTLIGPTSLYPGSSVPAKPGETVSIYANGFGPTTTPIVSGSLNQGGSLSPSPSITVAGRNAGVQFAGLVSPGLYQFNIVVPPNSPDGDLPITATLNGVTTQPGALLTVQH
jgi:uncharacterized protein (TIGR03437 family)